MSPRRTVGTGLGRDSMPKDNDWEFFRPDNKPFHRVSPKQDQLNRNSYLETS